MRASEGSEPAKADCEDPIIKAACLLDSDECPAECKGDSKDEKEDTVVKSGDLAVKATAATERKAILNNGVSDLDTITLKASEKITVNSITLERFGYSTATDVESVWLEDGDGNKIADEKSLSSTKDTVTLKIKKEYREMDASNALTIVLKTAAFEHCSDNSNKDKAECLDPLKWINDGYTAKKAGSTIGFKVTDVDASAKNLDISDYNPYTYELVSYDGATVTVTPKGNHKTYNYEEGEYYEVSKIRVKAGTSILALNGITLTNKAAPEGTAVLDLDEFVSKVKVTADGKEVSGLKWNATKDNELVLNWDTIEVAISKDVQIAVSIAMDNLDEFDKVVRLIVKDGDLNATEKKTGARVTVNAPAANTESWKIYEFHGSKIKFSNTKLSSTIDAAQGSQDVVIAQGKVTVAEEVKISELPFTVAADLDGIIEAMKLTVAGESYDASVSSDKTTFTFKNVIIEKSGDFELSVDVIDDEEINNTPISGKTVTIKCGGASSIAKAIFVNDNGRYESSRKYVSQNDVSGSISISSLKVQESKASLKNNKSQTVEFVKDETSDRTVVFEGTYTAKKSDITLKEFAIVGTATDVKPQGSDTTAEFYLYIDGEEVGNIDESEIKAPAAQGDTFDSYEDFSEVEVAAGKSVKVEVRAVVSPDHKSAKNINLDLYLRGEDKNGTPAGFAKAGLNTFKYVVNGSLTISDSKTLSKKTVVLQANEITMAKFTLKPSKSDSVKLDNIIFDLSDLGALAANRIAVDNNITVTVDGTEVELWEGKLDPADADEYEYTPANAIFDASDVDDITEEVEVEVKVTGLEPEAKTPDTYDDTTKTYNNDAGSIYTVDDAVDLTLVSVNGVAKNSKYTRLVLPAIATVDSQRTDGAVTFFRVNTDDYDGGQIQNMIFITDSVAEGENGTVGNGSEVEVTNQATSEIVLGIKFDIYNDAEMYHVALTNTGFSDYFKTTDGITLRVSKVSDK